MSVVQRGKRPQWPGAAGPSVSAPEPRGPALAAALTRAAKERAVALRWLENRDAGRSIAWFRRVARLAWERCNHLNAPVIFPWSPSRGGTEAVHEFHRFAAATARKGHGPGLHRLWLWTKACLWPLVATGAIPLLVFKCGRRVRDLHGHSLTAQTRDILGAAWRHGIFPTEYYHHRIFRWSPDRDRGGYLNERELRALLRACVGRADAARINHLPRFIEECQAAGLPVPRTPALAHGGQVHFAADVAGATMPARDLFLRPAQWRGRESGQHWRWNGQTRTWKFRDESRTAAELLEHVGRLAASRAYVLHESINNHPDIARFSAGGVCVAHLATGLDDRGEPQVMFASLHLPASTESGWGPGPGELVAGIDPATGRLDVAMDEFVSDGEFSVHPGTGVMIEGALVPQWSAMVDLALRAHRHFSGLPFVGWRIALSGGGPMLTEANTDWGVFRHVWPAETVFASWCRRRLGELARGSDPRGMSDFAAPVSEPAPSAPARLS